jgi:UDP-N-acetylglucosamine 2-epimerase (non-hydrolysing)
MVILGTRAELIKMFPLLQAIEEQGHRLTFLHTGQHDISRLCELFEIASPDKTLSPTPEESSKFKGNVFYALIWNLKLIFRIRRAIRASSPDVILYHGDTMSTALAAITSSRFSFPRRHFRTAHIEAGLRSNNLLEPFPEEIARILSDWLSNILFAVSDTSKNNLRLQAIIGKESHNVGNTIVDSVHYCLSKETFTPPSEDYGVVTLHRHENINSRKRLHKIIEILENSPRPLYFPLHDNTKHKLEQMGLLHRIEESETIETHELMEYPEFIQFLSQADIIYTDGGSIQEESIILNIPCVILRNITERKEGIQNEINYLSKFKVRDTIKEAQKMVKKEYNVENPYGRPGVAKRIVEKLENVISKSPDENQQNKR